MTEVEYKNIVIVNDSDEVIGSVERIEAIKEGAIRRASRVFVFDEVGRLLVQRRSGSVFSPLLLDQSVGGHVDENESYHEAAVRELYEELGLKMQIEEIVTSYRTKRFFNGIYRLIIPQDTPINFNEEEVSEVIWFKRVELEKMMQESPESFTNSFIEIWPMLRDKIIPS